MVKGQTILCTGACAVANELKLSKGLHDTATLDLDSL